MNNPTPSYQSDPHISYLNQILEEIRDGHIQVPRFQRPFVWKWEERLELFRSIRDGIPMGAIMVWRSQTQAIDCYSSLGPHRIKSQHNSHNQYLLDGVQRLSTLLGALSPQSMFNSTLEELNDEPEDDLPPSENFSVFYDFDKDDFVRAEDLTCEEQEAALSMSLVYDSVGLLRFQRNLKGDEQSVEEKIRKTESLSKAFREYKVPIIPIATENVEMATRTFQRINSQGRPMSEAHMIHALSWNNSFNLNSQLYEAKLNHLSDISWANIDDDVLLKACKVALGFDIYKKNADDIGRAFKENPTVLEEVVIASKSAANFLRSYCGIYRPHLTPYALQLVLLIDVFRNSQDLAENTKLSLTSWLWTTTYAEYFAGMSGDQFELARQDLQAGTSTNSWRITQFKPIEVRSFQHKFDFRAVRAKALSFRLAERMNQILSSNVGSELLGEYGRECIIQALPRTAENKTIYSSYANRFIVKPSNTATFKDKMLRGDFSATEMEFSFITDEMLQCLRKGDHEGFIAQRSDRLTEFENSFYEPHFEIMKVDLSR